MPACLPPTVPQPCCRYLLAIDGASAAYRFAFLLATNSVVLKQVRPGRRLSRVAPGFGMWWHVDRQPLRSSQSRQVTDRIEWYYRAVRACEHYLPFWIHNETDVVQLVQQLKGSRENDVVAQHIAANSQAFALTYLSDEYAFWYWQRAIDKYVALYRGPARGGSSRAGSVAEGGTGSGGGGGGGASSSSTAAPL